MNRIKNYLFYGDTQKEDYQGARHKIEHSNMITAMVFALVAIIFIGIMLALSYSQQGFSSSKPVYILGIVFSFVILLVAMVSSREPVLSYVAVYMAITVYLGYGIAIATLTRPEDQTVTFMVLLIFVPLIFVDRPIRMAIALIAYIGVFIVMALRTKTGDVLSVDITDAIIFGLLAIVSETVVYRAKIRGYVLENKLHIMSENDQLTGLHNRNSYEWKLTTYPSLYKNSIACIYIDANGLHDINASKGHRAGDDMLMFVADMFIRHFGRNDSFRVGGDEYVAFVLDSSREDIDARLVLLKEQVEERNYHIAVGCEYCTDKNANMESLILKAESAMYKDKADFYKGRGK